MPGEPPAFPVDRILRKRNQLFERVCLNWLEVELTGDSLQQFTQQLRTALPPGIPLDAVQETTRLLAGQVFSAPAAKTFSWLIAGNLPRLQAGLPVTPWTLQMADEWVPAVITRAEPGRNRHNETGFYYTFLMLAGTPTGMRVSQFWSRKQVNFFAKSLGFSKGRGKYRLQDPRQLVRLRLVVEVSAERSREQPFFWQLRCPGSMQQYNRDILAGRFRVVPCPENFAHACHVCAIGYRVCKFSTHRDSYLQGFCRHCQDPEAWFDPEEPGDRCVNCSNRWRLRPREIR